LTGNLLLAPIYNKYGLTNATSTSAIDTKIYLNPNSGRAALDSRRPAAMRKVFECFTNASRVLSGSGSRPRVRLGGKYQLVTGGLAAGTDYFVVNSVESLVPEITTKCATEIATFNRTGPDEE
jgi:hypothetical protein